MDIGTGLAVGGTAMGLSSTLLAKVLGPTADYLGAELHTLTEKKLANLSRIFASAKRKLGDNIDSEGAVPPRVLKSILNNGAFCDDELIAEYFGGVLASSKRGTSRDDRGAYFIDLISKLSTYQIRSHYIFYVIAKEVFDGTTLDPEWESNRKLMTAYITYDAYKQAMDFDTQEQKKQEILLSHIIFGLAKEGFIGDAFLYGEPEEINRHFKTAKKSGIIFYPTVPGIELFLWAHGKPNLTSFDFLKPENQFELDSNINIPPEYMKIRE